MHVLSSPYIILNMRMLRVEGVFGLDVLSAKRRLECRMISIHIIVFPEIKQKKKIYEVSETMVHLSTYSMFQ